MDPVERAARFIYLNKTCYNGLYRVNRQGVFNTPFGGRSDVKIVERASLMNASALLRACTLTQEDFEVILDHASPGDFVYIDPPYWPLEGYADFKRYTRDFFGKEDHRRLAACFRRLSDRGIKALLSNSSCPEVKNLYRGFHQVEVSATRQINCISTKRGKIKELLVTNYPLETENVFS
jgi:DNA adenine methylase